MSQSARVTVIAAGYAELEERAAAWASAEPAVRAAIVLGSRARDDHPADEWADLDMVVLVDEVGELTTDRRWLDSIGEPLISFVEDAAGTEQPELRVLFAGGFDVDFAFMSRTAIERMIEHDPRAVAIAFGRGNRVLVDKDRVAASVIAAGEGADADARTPRPDEHAFGEVCADFWYHTVWTAKHLRRGELWWAKSCCDGYLKHLLRIMLEWEAAAEERDPWFRGRFFEEWADPDTVAGLRSAFARYDAPEVWTALARTMDLFAGAGRRTATVLDREYPADNERHARALVQELRPPG